MGHSAHSERGLPMIEKWRELKDSIFVFLTITITIFYINPLFARDSLTGSSVVSVQKDKLGHWQLILNSSPYTVKGVCFGPGKVGEDPGVATLRDWAIMDDNQNGKIDSAYDTFVDRNSNNRKDSEEQIVGDFQLMKEMGVNTIRLYHHTSSAEEIQSVYNNETVRVLYDHPSNNALLRELHKNYGIMTMVGDFFGAQTGGSAADWESGTDYRDPQQQKNMLTSVKRMVLDFREEPFLLMYCLGNECDLAISRTNARIYPIAFAKFANEAAKLIHTLDPNHPVVLCLSGGIGSSMLEILSQYAPEVDIIGINYYCSTGKFGDIWSRIKKKWDKPIVVTEYGSLVLPQSPSYEDRQLKYHRNSWPDIENNLASGSGTGNALGGFIFDWVDNWWQSGEPTVHAGINEFCGIVTQGDGNLSPYLRQLRKVYFYYQQIWGGEKDSHDK